MFTVWLLSIMVPDLGLRPAARWSCPTTGEGADWTCATDTGALRYCVTLRRPVRSRSGRWSVRRDRDGPDLPATGESGELHPPTRRLSHPRDDSGPIRGVSDGA